MNPFIDDRELKVSVGDLRKVYALLSVNQYPISLFGEVGYLLNLIDEKLETLNEADVADRTPGDGSEG